MDSKLALSIACAEAAKGADVLAPLYLQLAHGHVVVLVVHLDRGEPPLAVVSSEAIVLAESALPSVTPHAGRTMDVVAAVRRAGQLPLIVYLSAGGGVGDLLVIGFRTGEVARA